MKKIALYINTIAFGGAERVMCNLANQLSDNNYEVVLITSFQKEKEYVYSKNVRRISLNDRHIDGFFKRNIYLIRRLRRVLRDERPDILISFMAEPNYRAILASLGLKNKVIISIRNDPNKEYPGTLKRCLAKALFCVADGVVFQTDDAKKWFPEAVQKKSEIIFNQVDERFYNVTFSGVRHDVVTTGRLTEQKNHKMLIRAFASIADQVSDNLTIYGDGILREELEALISDLHMENRVFLPGVTMDVAQAIMSAKVFVLSSDFEGMPNALMEAMAMGIPCISTDCPCGGPKLLFGDCMSERLVPCGDVNHLSEQMERLLTCDVDGSTERLLAERFRPERVFRKWVDYIESVSG